MIKSQNKCSHMNKNYCKNVFEGQFVMCILVTPEDKSSTCPYFPYTTQARIVVGGNPKPSTSFFPTLLSYGKISYKKGQRTPA